MFQELDQFLFSGNIEEAPTQYGLAAWAEKLCAGFWMQGSGHSS